MSILSKTTDLRPPSIRLRLLLFACFYFEGIAAATYHPLDDLRGFHSIVKEATLNHIHKFTHENGATGAHAFFEYNVTKCPKHTYVQIPSVANLHCITENEVVLTFRKEREARALFKKLAVQVILTSHHEVRCEGSGKGILLEITEVNILDELSCHIRGNSRNPAEFFQHAKIEFTTNVVPAQNESCNHRCGINTHENSKFRKLEIARYPRNEISKGAIRRLMKNNTSIDEFENLTQSAYDFYRSSGDGYSSVQPTYSLRNVATDSIKTPGGWRIPFPSEILWEDPIYPRMLCMDCYLRLQPVLRFSLHIENYTLKDFHLSIEANTYLAIFPHVDIHESGLIQRFKLLERSFQPVYLSINGIPYFITPHFKVTLKFAHKLNTKAEIGFQTGFIGAMQFGMALKNLSPELIGNMSFQQAPVDFAYSMGKSCKAFDGPKLHGTLNECALLCAKDATCNAFQYVKKAQSCRFTNVCKEVDNPTGEELLFKHQPWVKPDPNPRVTGTARIMVTSHLLMLINGIGGPMASVNQSLNWHFIKTDMRNVSRTAIDYKVSAAVGGRVQLRLGNSYIYEDELKFKPVVAHTESLWTHDYRGGQ
ncbi:hypothetical protein XU18_0211 [Perkinsela sp. CCAP 1560/4]|nr:hypothetical protein XU18_0211 [Perkinsela sp. CCAP 1560/4]|eukprot:KNH09526.1 hypothetical protein XU18_0211 [Perkinsela sp. CCAP 1560/4]